MAPLKLSFIPNSTKLQTPPSQSSEGWGSLGLPVDYVGRGLVDWNSLWIAVGLGLVDLLALLSRVSLYPVSDSIFLSRKAATKVPILKATRKLTTN